MARTGRPVVGRTRKSLQRDIATLKRLRKSVEGDEQVDRTVAASVTVLIDRLIENLLRLDIAA